MSALSRRGFLSLLGIGAAGIVAPVLVEPKRWFVSPKAPVRSRIQTYGSIIVRINGVEYGTGSAELQIGGVHHVHSMDEATVLLGDGSPLLPRIEADWHFGDVAHGHLSTDHEDAMMYVRRATEADDALWSTKGGSVTEDLEAANEMVLGDRFEPQVITDRQAAYYARLFEQIREDWRNAPALRFPEDPRMIKVTT